MTPQEMKATTLLTLKIDEVSAKISAGMPDDPPEDRNWPVWAGIIPVVTSLGTPEPAPDMVPGMVPPTVKFG